MSVLDIKAPFPRERRRWMALESVIFHWNISIDTSGGGFRVGEVENSVPFV